MALTTFAAGRYTGSYNSESVGITQMGYTLQQESGAEMINQTDAFGEAVIDWIYRGGNVFLVFESKTWSSSAIAAFWPYYTLGKMAGASNPIGTLASAIAAAMVLTAVANTPAAANAPISTSLTATYALLAPNSPAELLFDSRVRNTPVRLQLLPYASSTDIIWFTTS